MAGLSGMDKLTPRERQVLRLLARTGASGPEMADALGISPDTVRTHIHNIQRRLDVHSQPKLVSLAWRRGWV